MNPAVLVEPRYRQKKRARHSGILTLLSQTVEPNSLEPSRIQILEQLLAQNPTNAFARYGLAMEYVKSGDLSRAVAEFDSLLTADPAYSAAYFHGGQTYEKLGRLDEARDYYRRGIAATRDPHARSELQAALDILGD
jgi:tetratricopeptide (TPR) repeat protein